ncbi:MAG: 2-dehydropantoate 2-reductase [Planctomyces sp.]|nr:2-dehydropantoate 2-reductase [Planctomyces sp.]
MKIAVMGSGGIGSCYGGLLARAGCDVTLIARGVHLQAIQQNGLQIDRRDESFTIQVPATDDPSKIGPVDLVLFTVKTYQNSEAIPFMKPLMGEESAVLTLQNGVESAEQLAQEYGAQRVLPGAAYLLGHVQSPGVVKQLRAYSRLAFGDPNGSSAPRALAVQETLSSGGITVELSGDVVKLLWQKFLFNAPGNAIVSAARVGPSAIIGTPEGYEAFKVAFQEVVNVGKASGVDVEEDVETALNHVASMSIGARSSMQTDLAAGRPLELDAMVGAVGRIGRRVNVPTPMCDLLYAILLPYKNGPSGES